MSQNRSKTVFCGKLRSKIVSFRKNDGGSLAVPFALATIPLLLIAGSAVDYSRAVTFKSKLQSAVDASALHALNAPLETRQANTGATIRMLSDEEPLIVGDSEEVTVTATGGVATSFLALFGIDRIPVTAMSRARVVDGLPACLLALNTTESSAISFSGSSSFVGKDCVVHTNSTNATALSISNNSTPTAAGFCAVGGVSAPADIAPSPRSRCRSIKDPFAGLRKPDSGACTSKRGYTVGSNTSETLSPGTYCGGLTIHGNATLEPGVYVIEDGSLTVNAQASISGKGVTLYITGSKGGFTFNGGAAIDLHAPSSGTYGGVVIYQDPLSVGGGGKKIENTLNGNADSIINGGIYTPNQGIKITGTSGFGQRSAYMPVIADTISVSGSSDVGVDIAGVYMAAPLPTSAELVIVE
jgi:hypothetical protein